MRESRTRNRITRSEALAFRKRWEIANDFEQEEFRNTTESEKLAQLAMLMTFAGELDWTMASEAEDRKVRARWNKLRKAYHAKKGTPLTSP